MRRDAFTVLCLPAVFAIILISIGTQSQTASPNPPAPTAPQQASPNYETATVLKAITRLVVVDVVATNNKGEAITDLKSEDFTVLEDGAEQKVRAFNLQMPVHEPPQDAQQLAKLADNVSTNIPRYNVNNALNVILLDALNTGLGNQAYMRDEMLRYLKTIPTGQPVAVYTLGRKLTLLQDFTSDPEILRKAALNLKAESSRLQENPLGGTGAQILPTGFVDAGLVPAQMVANMDRFLKEETGQMQDMRVTITLEALRSIARALAGYPGRKNLLWISEAFPLDVNPEAALIGPAPHSYTSDLARVADNLIDAQVAVYPIDARGLTNSPTFDPASTGVDQLGRSMGANGGRLQSSISSGDEDLMSAHATMQEMAEKTGGRAYYNRNDLDAAIRSGIADGSTYYTLAYYPENKDWNGKFRKIQVKAKRPGVKLRYRLGYFAVDPKSFATQNAKLQVALFNEAMNIDYPISTGLHFMAGVIQPSESTQNKLRLNFAIDPHALSIDNGADGVRHATVECGVAVYDEKGKFLTMAVNVFKAEMTTEIYTRVMKSQLPCQHLIDLKPGKYLLRLGVRDAQTGLIGTSNARVTIAEAVPRAEEKKP